MSAGPPITERLQFFGTMRNGVNARLLSSHSTNPSFLSLNTEQSHFKIQPSIFLCHTFELLGENNGTHGDLLKEIKCKLMGIIQ